MYEVKLTDGTTVKIGVRLLRQLETLWATKLEDLGYDADSVHAAGDEYLEECIRAKNRD